jgi:hypothetical protein
MGSNLVASVAVRVAPNQVICALRAWLDSRSTPDFAE